MSTRPQITPSGWWFAVAGLVGVIGIVAGIVVIVQGVMRFDDRIDDFERAELPATLEVDISETGGYSIYHEYDDADLDYRVPPDVEVTGPSGDSIPVDTYDTSVTYDTGGHEGTGVYTFDADEVGTYTFEATMPVGERFDDGIAVGPGVGGRLAWSIIGGIAVMGVGVVGGIVIAIVVGVMRGRSRRALRPPIPAMAWGAPPGQWGAPPGQWGAPPGQWGAPWWQVPGGQPGAPQGPYAPGTPGAPGAPTWPEAPQAPPTQAPPTQAPPTDGPPAPQDAPPRDR